MDFCITVALRTHSTFELYYLELFTLFIMRNDDYALGQWFLVKRVNVFYEGIYQRRFWLKICFLVLHVGSWRCGLLSSFWELTLWFIKDIFKYWFSAPKIFLSFLWEVDGPSFGKLTWICLCWYVRSAALSTSGCFFFCTSFR
jgi:hypothetical protein